MLLIDQVNCVGVRDCLNHNLAAAGGADRNWAVIVGNGDYGAGPNRVAKLFLSLLFLRQSSERQKKQSKNDVGRTHGHVSTNIHTQTEQEALIEP